MRRFPDWPSTFFRDVTPQGQFTIPKPLRDHLGIKPGDRVLLDVRDGQLVIAPLRRSIVQQTAGSLKRYVKKGGG